MRRILLLISMLFLLMGCSDNKGKQIYDLQQVIIRYEADIQKYDLLTNQYNDEILSLKEENENLIKELKVAKHNSSKYKIVADSYENTVEKLKKEIGSVCNYCW